MENYKLYTNRFCGKCANKGEIKSYPFISKWYCDKCPKEKESKQEGVVSIENFILQGTENILIGILKSEFNALTLETNCFSKSRVHSRDEFMGMIKEEIRWITGKEVNVDEDKVVKHIKHLVENVVTNVTCDIDDEMVVITINRD